MYSLLLMTHEASGTYTSGFLLIALLNRSRETALHPFTLSWSGYSNCLISKLPKTGMSTGKHIVLEAPPPVDT